VGDSIRLGRVAGIAIGVNWSWLVALVLITWTLAAGVFPAQNPGLGDATHVGMAIVAAALFFGSLLLHELGHALQARRDGMTIEGITLWLFGGVAKFSGRFPSAPAELRIAAAGPLVTLVLGFVFVAIAAMAGLPEPADGVAAWLGYANLALLIFNLLPAVPLDGGRMLRAALWTRLGLARATEVAGFVAQSIAFGLIGLGLVLFVVGGAFGGVWLAFIGWFLLQAAATEVHAVLARRLLAGLRVRDVMVTEPVTVEPGMSLERFVDDVVWKERFTTYPVVDGGEVVGLLPFRCVAEVPRSEWQSRTVADCAIPLERVPLLHESQPLADAVTELSESELNRGLVTDEGRLVGLVSATDVARILELRRLKDSKDGRGARQSF
jgi:Zn-dependent protease